MQPNGYPPPKPLTDEQKRQAEGLIGIAWWVVKTRHQKLIRLAGRHEVHSLSMWALVNAVRTFDPAGGASLKTHAARSVDLQLRRLFGRTLPGRRKFEVLTVTDLNCQPRYDGNGVSFEDYMTGGHEPEWDEVETRDEVETVRRLAERLPPSMRRVVLECLSGRHRTHTEIAAEIGCGYKYVGMTLKDAAGRINAMLNGGGA